MDLTTVHTGCKKRKLKRRVGRGIGSGQGKTAGRGIKGQYASAGAEFQSQTFVGGQSPLFRRVPKRGFTNAAYGNDYAVVNLGDVDRLFSEGEEVNPASLKEKGLATKPSDGVRILGNGLLKKKLVFKVHGFSGPAKKKIEECGGTAIEIEKPKKPVRNKMKPKKPKAT